MIKGAFNILVVLLVIGYFAGSDSDTEKSKKQVKQETPAKVWTESEKQTVYSALNEFCKVQNYTCMTGSYVTFTKAGKIKPVVRVTYQLDWYVTKDLRAVSLHNAKAVSNYLKFNTSIDGTIVDRTMIKLVHPNGKEERFL